MAFVTIVIHFDPKTGKQREKNGLVVTTTDGTEAFHKGGHALDGQETPDDVLWGENNKWTDTLSLVEGSNCVVIGGRKYCA